MLLAGAALSMIQIITINPLSRYDNFKEQWLVKTYTDSKYQQKLSWLFLKQDV